jgi:two-component system, chemotaxis family, sensor kinase Cph1
VSTEPRQRATPMTEEELAQALDACAAEPIHIPGSIQPHGVLLAIDEDTLVVERVSANCATLLARPPDEVLGQDVTELLVHLDEASLRGPNVAAFSPFSSVGAVGPIDISLHRSGGYLLMELEAAVEAEAGALALHRVRGSLDRLQGSPDLDTLVATTATEIRRITGFDRVLVYRFDDEWNGEVVAEDLAEGLEPFLGLRFPASDIPAQARALYTTNWLRLIADRDYEPVPILPDATGADGAPLDLSACSLRSVSPIHLEYLRNMGVVASMSISLIDEDRLWGLISCHHPGGALRPTPSVRAAAEFLGRTVSALLPATAAAGTHERSIAIRDAETIITQRLVAPDLDPAAALACDALLELTGAIGAAARIDDRLVTVGTVPPDDGLDAIASALLGGGRTTASTRNLGQLDPALAQWSDVVAGAAVTQIGPDADQWVLCVRPEVARTVTWGGSPDDKPVRSDGRLGPRTSFAAWTEVVRGNSDPWSPDELEALERIGSAVTATLLRRTRLRDRVAATLNRALLLEELPDLDGVELCVKYRPAARAAIGGDWYDVFPLPNGRIAIAVGDVAGHGVGAAPMMAHLRHGLRAYLFKAPGPAEALTRLNDLVAALLPQAFATAVVADLDPTTGVVRLANAGHLPPVTVSATTTTFHHENGPALGVRDGIPYATTTLTLEPGSALFLYTDGVVERRTEPIDVGLERVSDTIAAGDLEVACAALMALAVDHSDDATVVGLARPLS